MGWPRTVSTPLRLKQLLWLHGVYAHRGVELLMECLGPL